MTFHAGDPRRRESIVADLSKFDIRPFALAGGEKRITSVASWVAILVGRCREVGIPTSSTKNLPGVKWPTLHDLLIGRQNDCNTEKMLALIDGLGLELVVRPKPVPLGRMGGALKRKALEEAPAGDPEPEDDPVGEITPELRAEIEKMLKG